ncbi:MAG TPA: type II toxin-antitoxin system MqsR family toxin [Gammaproteobacteria bacterium]|nr:type II toxin-antitoxin system MqsR family toxin [Gammaproteobacteria bacterium]
MVSPAVETKDEPDYSLDGVHRLAGFRQIAYAGKRVMRHVDELGFNLDDIGDCLASLQPLDFHRSERYTAKGRWHDVYLLRYRGSSGPTHDLYIKFRLNTECVLIDLCSFHPEGWL